MDHDSPTEDNTRRLDSAPSARAAHQHAEAAFARLVARLGDTLQRQEWAKVSVATDDDRDYVRRAARTAAQERGLKIRTRTTSDSALMIMIDETPGPLEDQREDARMRNAIDDAFGYAPPRDPPG